MSAWRVFTPLHPEADTPHEADTPPNPEAYNPPDPEADTLPVKRITGRCKTLPSSKFVCGHE